MIKSVFVAAIIAIVVLLVGALYLDHISHASGEVYVGRGILNIHPVQSPVFRSTQYGPNLLLGYIDN